MKMDRGSKMQVLKLKNILISVLLLIILISVSDAKTLKVDTVTPSVTNGDFTITPNGTGDIVIGSGSGFVKLTSGVLSNQAFIDVTADITGALPIANGGTGLSAVGTSGQLLSSNGSALTFIDPPSTSPTTTGGDLIYNDGGGAASDTRLPLGTSGQLLSSNGTIPAWVDPPSTSPTTTQGDLILRGATEDERLAIGSSGKLLTSNGTTASWELPPSGTINYITNYNIEVDTTGYATFDDASAYVDGTGGTAANLTLTRNTTTPLRETGDLKLVQAAIDSRYEGVSYDFTIDKGQQAEMLTGSFWYDASDANYVDNDIRIFIYDVTNSQIIRVNGEDIKGGKGVHYFQFQTASNSTSYRISFMVNQENTAGFSIYFDQIAVSPTRLARGAIVTAWETFTPTGSSWINGSVTPLGYYRRVGDTMEVTGEFSISGSTGAFPLEINIPNGLSINTATIPPNIRNTSYGVANYFDDSAGVRVSTGVRVAYNSSTTVTIFSNSSQFNQTTPITWANNDKIYFEFTVPIAGWEASGTLNEDLGGGDVVVEGAGNGGTAITANVTDIDFTETRDTAGAWNGTQFTAPSTGEYLLNGAVVMSGTGTYLKLYKNGSFLKGTGILGTFSLYPLNATVRLIKGDTLSIRSNTNETLIDDLSHTIHIQKLASGSQKFETATVAARYTSDSGSAMSASTASIVAYEDVEYDTHGIYNSGTGVGTIPISGKYHIAASMLSTSVAWTALDTLQIRIRKNGSSVVATTFWRAQTALTAGAMTHIATDIDFVKGDTFDIFINSSQTISSEAASGQNFISIHRIK